VCALLSTRVAVVHETGVSVMEISDEEEQGGGSNENPILTAD